MAISGNPLTNRSPSFAAQVFAPESAMAGPEDAREDNRDNEPNPSGS
jgi:hypothetical protein